MLVTRNKLFATSPTLSEDTNNTNNTNSNLAASGLAIGGGALLAGTKYNKLTGREVRYHVTSEKNIPSILNSGIKASYSTDPNNLTNRVLKNIPMDKKEGLVYLGKSKKAAKAVQRGRGRVLNDPGKRLKLVFNYDDLKNLPTAANPELLGKTNPQDWFNTKMSGLGVKTTYDQLDPIQRSIVKKQYDILSTKGTHVIRGDVSASNIVGGVGYKKRSFQDVKNYIKNNPKRFGKEALKVGLGGAALGTAGYLMYRNYKKKKENNK